MGYQDFRQIPIGGGSSTVFPFNAVLTISGVGNTPYVLIQDGSLLKSLQPSDKQAIVGLNENFTVTNGDNIWLELQFDSNGDFKAAPDGANINHGDTSLFDPTLAAWDSAGKPYLELNIDDPANPYEQYARILIAQVSGAGANTVILQRLTTNLIMNNSCIDFRAAQFPIPASYSPYIAPA